MSIIQKSPPRPKAAAPKAVAPGHHHHKTENSNTDENQEVEPWLFFHTESLTTREILDGGYANVILLDANAWNNWEPPEGVMENALPVGKANDWKSPNDDDLDDNDEEAVEAAEFALREARAQGIACTLEEKVAQDLTFAFGINDEDSEGLESLTSESRGRFVEVLGKHLEEWGEEHDILIVFNGLECQQGGDDDPAFQLCCQIVDVLNIIYESKNSNNTNNSGDINNDSDDLNDNDDPDLNDHHSTLPSIAVVFEGGPRPPSNCLAIAEWDDGRSQRYVLSSWSKDKLGYEYEWDEEYVENSDNNNIIDVNDVNQNLNEDDELATADAALMEETLTSGGTSSDVLVNIKGGTGGNWNDWGEGDWDWNEGGNDWDESWGEGDWGGDWNEGEEEGTGGGGGGGGGASGGGLSFAPQAR